MLLHSWNKARLGTNYPRLWNKERVIVELIMPAAVGELRGSRWGSASSKTLPVPGSVGAGPSLLGPPLIQGCLLSLAQITEAGRTHELQPAKSPHGQMCVCAWQLQIHHPFYTHTSAAGAAAAAMRAVLSVCCSKKKLKKKKEERTSLYRAHLCQQENKPLIRSTVMS